MKSDGSLPSPSKREGMASENEGEDAESASGDSERAKLPLPTVTSAPALSRDDREWLYDVKKVEDPEKPALRAEQGLSGFYVIIQGHCKVVHLKDGHEATQLQGGDCFGESDLLKIVGFDFFGDIIADSAEVQCLYISTQNFGKIPLFEQNNIRDYARQRRAISYLAYQYCEKYQLEYADYA